VNITYDPQVDALYIAIRPVNIPARNSIELEPGVCADLDAAGQVLGLEILSDAVIGIGSVMTHDRRRSA
jgi:uncharacterized protein YuzE